MRSWRLVLPGLAGGSALKDPALTPLALRQSYEDEPRPDCTDVSFSRPVFHVYDPLWTLVNATTGGTVGDFRFAVLNEATGVTSQCLARNVTLTATASSAVAWHSCRDDATQFRYDVTANEFELRQTWACNNSATQKTDNGILTSPWHFIGYHKTPLPVELGCYDETADSRGRTRICLLADINFQAGLVSPIDIYPLVPQEPFTPYFWPDTCVERSENPGWRIDDLSFTYTSRDVTSTPIFGILLLNLTNNSNGDRLRCFSMIDDLELDRNHADRWIDCGVEPFPSESKRILSTQVMFNREYNVLAVNQTWKCDEEAVETHTGVGFLVSPLNCTTATSSSGPVIGSYECSLAVQNFTGYDVRDVPPLPHTHYARSCTINSLNTSQLTLRQYDIKSVGAGGPTHGSITLFNPGPGDEYKLRGVPIQGDGEWRECVADIDPLPWQLVSCEYLLNLATGAIGFKIQWYCDDRNPETA